ncbi:uncharacterized protein IUM83_06380 [Phytophthora cinnamomi]|uniref:uncharacterized protein n=1 Tax=Phytophthora cinnamomi TaxID=4785 RepID=UPI003559CDE2|nr:hypothetical protein IUM83_09555 [Phytophthora cinnamomi]KAG6623284.1 hypothetical protein IUM83_06380 [Phytophthora cinnamomi]
MMEPADEHLLSEATPLSHIIEKDPPCSSHPERGMVFHCRPDLSGRRLLFQDRNSNSNDRERRQTAPVQLLTMDGRSHLGLSVARDPSTPSSDSSFYSGQYDDKLARILVTTNPQNDSSSQLRLRRLQLTVAVAAIVNILLTVLFLCPASTDAWYHVDAYRSPRGSEDIQRVLAVRPTLIALAVASNSFFVLAAYLRMDALLTVYISATVVFDVWSLVLLLPHALFLFRLLLDALLIAIALEVRTHLEHTWFLTSFHRLRA